MYYAVVAYLPELSQGIADVRRIYDPTSIAIRRHVTVLFPVPDDIELPLIIDHIESVVSSCSSFQCSLGTLYLSPDRWLLLSIDRGRREFARIHNSIYSGPLSTYLRTDLDYEPHTSIGLFIKDHSTYNWDSPTSSKLDSENCDRIRSLLAPQIPDSVFTIDTLYLVSIPDAVIEWATGTSIDLTHDDAVSDVHAFVLSAPDA